MLDFGRFGTESTKATKPMVVSGPNYMHDLRLDRGKGRELA